MSGIFRCHLGPNTQGAALCKSTAARATAQGGAAAGRAGADAGAPGETLWGLHHDCGLLGPEVSRGDRNRLSPSCAGHYHLILCIYLQLSKKTLPGVDGQHMVKTESLKEIGI